MNTTFPIRKVNPNRSEQPVENSYKKYKEALKKDFNRCCGYCGIHHQYFASGAGFHIDHFAPKSKFSELETSYSNLVYSCSICNIAKSNDWCGDDAETHVENGIGYIDPCDDKYEEVFYRECTGKIIAHQDSSVAQYMHKRLKFGLKRHEIFWLAEYFRNTVSKLGEKFEKVECDHPMYDEIKQLLTESIAQMTKYAQLQREI